MGMLKPGDRLGLGQEPRHFFRCGMSAGQDHLERAGSIESNVVGLVDDAHAATAQLAEDLISRHLRFAAARGCIAGRHVG